MLNSRYTRLLVFITIGIVIFMYGHHYSARGRSPAPLKAKPNCEKGSKCSTTTLIISKTTRAKPTKAKLKKVTKAPYIEKMHILPKDVQSNVPQELVYELKTHKLIKRKVLIISYFDWGPPHIGDILSFHPDIFYFNEPLFPFDSTTLKDGEEPISRRFITEATEYLEDLFDCKILDSRMGYSDQTIKKMAKKAFSFCSGEIGNVSECIQATCVSSQIIISKTIRLYIQDVRSFLMKNKGISKVILLQRDPRANLNLRNKKVKPGWIAGSDMFFQGRSLCSRMLHDIQEAKRLEGGGFKDFYRIVLFEHFLKSPELVLKGLFSFLGVSLDEENVRRLLKQSSAYKQIRRVTINKWDWIPDDDAALSVDKACSFFYKNSLYNPMKQSKGYVQRYNLCKYCE